jgi:predicted ATPase
LVAAAVADAVGAPNRPGRDRRDDMVEHLRQKRALVIFDDCEPLLDACSREIRSIEAECPGVAVLATSREPLRTPGEILWRIQPLSVPSESSLTAPEVLDSPAVLLFAERAGTARPGFRITDSNAVTVGEICRQLDGLPLAIELAAALVTVQSPAEILKGLDDRFRILRSRNSNSASRHESIESLLSWSYESLSDEEQKVFRSLSVFSSSFSIEAAAAAIGLEESEGSYYRPLLWSLVDRSLVQPDLTAETTRYRLLHTMRGYGRELLDAKRELAKVATKLSDYYLSILGPWLPPDRSWATEVAQEIENLRTLIQLLPQDHHENAQEIACILGRYHGDVLHTYVDGIEEVERYVRLLAEPSPTRTSLLTTLAFLHLRGGETDGATRLVREAADLREHVGIPEWDEVAVERARGEIARRSGDFEAAVTIARDALEGTLTDRSRSRMYNLLGTSAGALGDMNAAKSAFEEELELNRSLGDEAYVAAALGNLAEVAMRQGDFSAAARYQLDCLEQAVALGSVTVLAFSMITAARIAGHLENWSTSVRLHSKGERLLEKTGLVLYDDDRRHSDELLDRARDELGVEEFDQAAEMGAAMEMDSAVDLTREQLSTAAAPHTR